MKRLRWLDVARGVAVVIMIECHTFNCYTRPELRATTGYQLSQQIGGMASVLFLFLAGMTCAFQMASGDRRGQTPFERWRKAMGRAGYLLALAYAFRLANWAVYLSRSNWQSVFKVDILNCMGLAMALLSVTAICEARWRPWMSGGAGLLIAAASPLVGMLDWSWAPKPLYAYVVGQNGAFAAFPFSSYMAFGLAAGCLVRARLEAGLDKLMRWTAAGGAVACAAGWWFERASYSPYPRMDYLPSSPAVTAVHAGLALVVVAGAYAWRHARNGEGWSWIETLGKQSLLVYFVHIMLVYGWLFTAHKRRLEVWESALATLVLTAGMVALAETRLRWRTPAIATATWLRKGPAAGAG